MPSLRTLIASLPDAHCDAALPDVQISRIVSDNRRVVPGSIFCAYRGVKLDGHRFITDAIARGAAAVVCEDAQPGLEVPVIRVRNGREAFAHLCAAWHGHPSRAMIVIGVTGTDGKTSTSNILYGILRAAGYTCGLISTVNAVIDGANIDTGLHVTTPNADDVQQLLARMRDAGVTHCVLEVTSHALSQYRVDGVAFDIAVITNITHEHLDEHGSREAYRAAKARLFEFAPVHVLNADDAYSFDVLSTLPHTHQLRYSLSTLPRPDDSNWWLRASPYIAPDGRLDATELRAGQVTALPLETQLIGSFNVANTLAATGVALAIGVPIDAIQRGVAGFSGIPGRMERIDAGQDYLAVVDFAHTPNALENCLRALRPLTTGRLCVAFGSAGTRDVQKRALMGVVAARLADLIVLTAEDPRNESFDAICDQIESGMPAARPPVHRFFDRGQALQFLCAQAGRGDIVVACGKGHEQSNCFGNIEYAWDDRVALRAAIGGIAMPRGAPLP
jgi:UDP-N-acetylmuramoyl-L-alanyl-D-glutamate--2,6-diaminopimelate ligase